MIALGVFSVETTTFAAILSVPQQHYAIQNASCSKVNSADVDPAVAATLAVGRAIAAG